MPNPSTIFIVDIILSRALLGSFIENGFKALNCQILNVS